ncbi:MAG: type II toxin-antitoxin system HicA family toxin [Magnetococcales bacterium]|nr:type II toxin-antitoxin system HicA family toxin [Magnetococcales bacterium]
MNGNELIRKLIALGAVIDKSHGKGSHVMIKWQGRISFVPMHGPHDIPTGTLRSICRQLGLDPRDLG